MTDIQVTCQPAEPGWRCSVRVADRGRTSTFDVTARDPDAFLPSDAGWPEADVDELKAHLEVFPRIARGDQAAGPIAQLPRSQRFHWLVAPRSTVLQVSPVHAGQCDSAPEMVEKLLQRFVRR